MAHKFIDKIAPGEQIDEVYVINQPILRSTTRGDLYIAMFVSDRTGKLNGRMWQATEQIYNSLPTEGFAHIVGRSEVYQNALQIIINNISVVDADKVSLSDYLPRTDKDVKVMFERVKKIVGGLKNKQLHALSAAFLADEKLMRKFCTAPAAMVCHHGYLGGLLEHTLNMLEVAVAVLPFYPQVQAELVLAGIFLHDIGKTEELSYNMAFGYTDSGQLLGHISQSLIMVEKKAEAVAGKGMQIDKAMLDNIKHIILAHHGQHEFGSPKLPATLEAFMVNYIDNLDAKMNQVAGAIEAEPGDGNWTRWQKTLQTRLYRKRVVE